MTASWAQRWQGRDRIVPAIAALLVNVVIGYALIIGLRAPSLLRSAIDSTPLALFNLKPPTPDQSKPPPPEEARKSKREGGAASGSPPRAEKVRDQPPPRPSVVALSPVINTSAPTLPTAPTASITSGAGGAGSGATPGFGSGSGGTGTGTGREDGEGGDFSRARHRCGGMSAV